MKSHRIFSVVKNKISFNIWNLGSHSDEDADGSLLGFDAVWLPTFWRNLVVLSFETSVTHTDP
jgi:hypothetical protein